MAGFSVPGPGRLRQGPRVIREKQGEGKPCPGGPTIKRSSRLPPEQYMVLRVSSRVS